MFITYHTGPFSVGVLINLLDREGEVQKIIAFTKRIRFKIYRPQAQFLSLSLIFLKYFWGFY